MTKKITRATFKSFINKNRDKLYVRVDGRFDGMTDCVQRNNNAAFFPAKDTDLSHENTLGVQGVWLVNGSRDRYSEFKGHGYTGIEVYNCCGSFIVAIRDTEVAL